MRNNSLGNLTFLDNPRINLFLYLNMEEVLKRFSENLITLSPPKAYAKALQETKRQVQNVYTSKHSYVLAKRDDVLTYKAEFISRLAPFFGVVREQLKNFIASK